MKFAIKLNWLYIILAMFLLVVLVNIGYLFLANRFNNSPVVENAFLKGLEYNKTIEIFDSYKKSGYELNFDIKPSPNISNTYNALITLENKEGELSGAEVEVIFLNKIKPQYNFYRTLQFLNGNYIANNLYFPTIGSWDLKLLIKKDNIIIFQEDKQIVIPEYKIPAK
jgi:nitrogen fixation protein FixH